MPRGYKIPPEKKAQIIEMSMQGFSPHQIHQKTGVKTKTISNIKYEYFKDKPERKEAMIRRMKKRSQRQGVPKIIRRKPPKDERGPFTRTVVEFIGDRLEDELYFRGLNLTPVQVQIIKEEVAGYNEPDLAEYGPVTQYMIKHIRDKRKRANERYYYY
jgi:hypothetical protein